MVCWQRFSSWCAQVREGVVLRRMLGVDRGLVGGIVAEV